MGSLTLTAGGLYLPVVTEGVTGKFAATDGNGTTGAIDDPYSITAAFAAGAVSPGETLWLRGGTYYWPTRTYGVTGHPVYLQGTAESPITIRPYPGERAIMDGGVSNGTAPAHLRIRDLEVIVSENIGDARASDGQGEYTYDLGRPWGGINFTAGTNLKFINNIVHANMQGVGFWQNLSGNSELYGNLIYDNGWTVPNTDPPPDLKGQGHGIYTQNGGTHEDWKYIRNNMLLDNWNNSAQAYGSSSAYVDRYWVSENIVARGPHTYDGRFLIGGSRPSYQLRVHDNVSYHAALQVGYNFYSGNRGDDVIATGNRIWSKIEFGEMTNYTRSNNWDWYWLYWANPKMDGVTVDPSATPFTFVYPNEYDSSRAHVAVMAFQEEETATLNVSGFLSVGDNWELMDPQDFYGDPLQSGTCSDTTITVALADEWLCGVLMNRGSV